MRKNILLINSTQKQCGVYQYGARIANILNNSIVYNFIHCEISSEWEYDGAIKEHNPLGIIYNYHPLTMEWFRGCTNKDIKHYVIHHEGTEHTNLTPDYWLYADSMIPDEGNKFSLPRPLFENHLFSSSRRNPVPVISTFGFGFGNKGFGRVVKAVNDEFDEAIIRLHIPRAFYGDRDGSATAQVLPGCKAEMKKPNVILEITDNFLTNFELLKFLSRSDLNVFLYDDMPGRGLSSVIDYALSVDVPIAINKTYMFRHIYNADPSICVEDKSLKQIIEQGTYPLNEFKDKWSNTEMRKKINHILKNTL